MLKYSETVISLINALDEIITNVILVTRLKPEVKFAPYLSAILAKLSPEISIEEENYNNHTIYVASIAKFNIRAKAKPYGRYGVQSNMVRSKPIKPAEY